MSREDRKFAIKNLEDWNREVDGYFSAKEKYRDTAGEAMARLTEARRQLTPGERLEDYPFEPRSFERLTKSRIEDLWDPPSGGGVQSSIGPVYKGARNPEHLSNSPWVSEDPSYAEGFSYEGEAPVMGKYSLPDEGAIDFSKDPVLRRKFLADLSEKLKTHYPTAPGEVRRSMARENMVDNIPHFELQDAVRQFLDNRVSNWSSIKMSEGDVDGFGEGAGISYMLRDPNLAKLLFGPKK
jgi:hypothetical protein